MRYGIIIVALTLMLVVACKKPDAPNQSELRLAEANSLVKDARDKLSDSVARRDGAIGTGNAGRQLDLIVKMNELTLDVAQKYLTAVESGNEDRSFVDFKQDQPEFIAEMTRLSDALYSVSGQFAREQAEMGEALRSADSLPN